MTRRSFRSLLVADGPLILPGAHDVGLKSLGDLSLAVHDILAACDLPVLVDADDGDGDVKNVVHTVHSYEQMGVGALFLEDQR